MRAMYKKYLQNKSFSRMILLFAFITVTTIIAFSYLMYDFMSQSIIRSELDKQKKAMESVDVYLGGKYESAQSIITDVLSDNALNGSVTYLLRHPIEQYLKYRLDHFDISGAKASGDSIEYFRKKIEADHDIRNLILYSDEQQLLYAYNTQKTLKQYTAKAGLSYIPDAMAMGHNDVSVPNKWVRKLIGQQDPRLYAVDVPITDIITLKKIGQMVVYYNSDGLMKALSSYKNDLRGSLLVLTADGQVVFDSSGVYYGKKYPYAEKINNNAYQKVMLEEESYINMLASNKAGYRVVGITPISELAESYGVLKRTTIMISLICILVLILIPSVYVINYAKRTNQILRFMNLVKGGELTKRIQDTKEDELGQISRNFNDMLDELNRYIDSVYKAEIKQKHTELAALQARVNPHFLYNTLEVIRMRAISQGAGDVGEMIYSLSVLFKNTVQNKKVYTLKDELEVCRMFLELFRIRYKDKFAYTIECDKRLESVPIVKMLLQPLVENYIVHGIRTDRIDNAIAIRVKQDDPAFIHVLIEDNGKGMSSEQLAKVRRMLNQPEPHSESFGISSVYERLRLLFGDLYGIEMNSTENEGTEITLWFPTTGGKLTGDV
ncbi:sensor histidine kinase [Paenibacillus montanisoli]|uniref:Two-component sensor histidine kinase n=1 Tax=Paenibacillus montanisoli TaxID=2081970 RepID=A0A328U093_9BACL|nr:sensor histidine kinase [Paenibacillus montanisoli]RAP75193.1 two-component sensor histidine kinase [Paenibacillus montanisoli]